MSTGYIVLLAVLAFIIVALAIAIIRGKADLLMIDYYFSPPEKREQYNVQRLRFLTGIALLLIFVSDWILLYFFNGGERACILSLIIIIALYKTLEHTWAKNNK